MNEVGWGWALVGNLLYYLSGPLRFTYGLVIHEAGESHLCLLVVRGQRSVLVSRRHVRLGGLR